MGWFKNISLDFRHSPRTSDSASCTLFPGRPRATKVKINFTSSQEKVKEKAKDMKCPNLLTSGILCYQHSSRPPPYQLPNKFLVNDSFWRHVPYKELFSKFGTISHLILSRSKMATKMAAFMSQNCNLLWRSLTLQNLSYRLIFGRMMTQRLVIFNHKRYAVM